MGQSRGSCGFFNVTFAVMGFGNFGMSMGDFCLTVEGPPQKKMAVWDLIMEDRAYKLVVVAVLEMRMFGLGNQQAIQNCHEFCIATLQLRRLFTWLLMWGNNLMWGVGCLRNQPWCCQRMMARGVWPITETKHRWCLGSIRNHSQFRSARILRVGKGIRGAQRAQRNTNSYPHFMRPIKKIREHSKKYYWWKTYYNYYIRYGRCLVFSWQITTCFLGIYRISSNSISKVPALWKICCKFTPHPSKI